MLEKLTRPYDRIVALLSSRWAESLMLLFVRVALAGIFWRSGQTKVEEGSLLSVSENTLYQFADDPFNKLPLLPAEFAAHLTTYAEHLLPILLVAGLFTRLSALALLGMTLVIQIFIFPDAWWPVHSLWVALALVLIVRGGGDLSLDKLLTGRRT
ncbi:DoxX family protein [Sphingorhabdus sp.]|jgi:putative oxidoreductase|uniref:DoxX family protein n=1 Tax=Sphingorhabdus sp. TaxID=1902408 RepID=UPI003BB220F9|nr:DoxX family protein [Sphingomonadales bacterium]MBK9430924.1 DoxX family protein [Sphingomonadales bacterium]